MIEFQPFPKIGRLRRNIVITEKLDGTNAAVRVTHLSNLVDGDPYVAIVGDYALFAQSRSRLITPGKTTDNFGFAGWVSESAPDLVNLGEGTHFGEWWGRGIQRGYGLAEKRFSLFNTTRWVQDGDVCPASCYTVPVLYEGPLDEAQINGAMTRLGSQGSVAAPGFMKPEGIIVFHTAQGALFKQTFEKDDTGKEQAA